MTDEEVVIDNRDCDQREQIAQGKREIKSLNILIEGHKLEDERLRMIIVMQAEDIGRYINTLTEYRMKYQGTSF